MDSIQILTIEIAKLSIEDGDYLAIKFPEDARSGDIEQIGKALQEAMPNIKILCFWGDIKLEVIHKNG